MIERTHPPAPSFDVFVSYRQQEPDLSWVRCVLVPRFKADNLSVFIDCESFRLGVPLVKEMGRGVESSRYTVAVITPRYLESGFTELESVLAQHVGLEQRKHRLVPVLREASAPWLGVRAVIGIDMSDDSTFETDAARLCAHLHTDTGGP